MSNQNSLEQENTLPNPKSRTKPVQTKLSVRVSKDHPDYWTSRIRKRIYIDRDGTKTEGKDWQVRIEFLGRVEWFNLQTGNKSAASTKARDIFQSLRVSGWNPTLAKYKPKGEHKEVLSITEFVNLCRELVQTVEHPPSKQTFERYIKSLCFVCRHVKIHKIQDLTHAKVELFKGEYLAEARKDKDRDEDSIKTTINFILRNAGALFSKQMQNAFKVKGLAINNPFVGQKLRRVEIKAYSPLKRELVDEIWRDSILLRDGNPNLPKTAAEDNEKGKRWKKPDFRKSHPESYTILLLEFGLGLRRNESDKAQWDWIFEKDGRHFIEVKQTPYFTPKSKKSRIIPIDQKLYEAITATRMHVEPWIVHGRLPKRYERGDEPKNIVYRCDQAHRTLIAWLHSKGIDSDKPCQLLRKEFGSYVATSFNLYYAQKLLGHSTPEVTSRYYAGLTDLPELKNAMIPKEESQKLTKNI